MPYLVKENTIASTESGESYAHEKGTVLSDWEVSDHIRAQIKAGVEWFRRRFEPLTESEALAHRIKATNVVGARTGPDGKLIEPPWEDYIGLHPEEVCRRLREEDRGKVEQARAYERAGMARPMILDFVAPSEREPFAGYDEVGVREILEKMSISSDPEVQDLIAYEMSHRKRPAIISWERESYEPEPETASAVT